MTIHIRARRSTPDPQSRAHSALVCRRHTLRTTYAQPGADAAMVRFRGCLKLKFRAGSAQFSITNLGLSVDNDLHCLVHQVELMVVEDVK